MRNCPSAFSKASKSEGVEKLFIYAEQLTCQRFEKSKTLVYRDELDPLFVDSTSNKDFFPTVYCLSLFPDVAKFTFKLKADAEKGLKGGQVGWSDVTNIDELPEFNGDEVVSLQAADGRVVAVGAIACSKKALEEPDKRNGPAAYILHTADDTLFELGSKQHKKPLFKKPTADELKKQTDEQKATEEKETKRKAKDGEAADDDLMAFYNQLNKNKTNTGVKTAGLK